MPHTRRRFLRVAALAALGAAAPSGLLARPLAPPQIAVFTKHLQYLSFEELAAVVAEAGFDGIDMAVRPGGHIEPADAARKLPQAARAAEHAGVRLRMMATGIDGLDAPFAEPLLRAAADVGVTHYRLAWLPYPPDLRPEAALDRYNAQLQRLADLNRRLGLHGAYQNHAGTLVGGPIWDIDRLLRGIDPAHIGVQYDVRHNVVEGGTSWPVDLRLIAPRINMLAVKDFRWEQRGGKWQPATVPLGEGMVDYPAYLGIVKSLDIRGPITMHFEYPFPGEDLPAPARAREAARLMRTDRERLLALLGAAGLA